MKTYADSELNAAAEVSRDSWHTYHLAEARMASASAVFLGMTVLMDHAAIFPGVTGYSWDYEAEYDDEGSYFDRVTVRPYIEETPAQEDAVAEHGDPLYDFEILQEWDRKSAEAMFGGFVNEVVPIVKMQERIAELRKDLSEGASRGEPVASRS